MTCEERDSCDGFQRHEYRRPPAVAGECDGTSLYLVRRRLTDEERGAVFDFLDRSQKITHVDMRKCGTGMEGARQLHKMLKRNHPPLKSLFLFQNHVGDEGLRHICESLRYNHTLRKVILCDNEIGPEGAECVGQILRSEHGLAHIDLNNNHIGDEGLLALSAALEDNTTLRVLSTWNNGITDAAGQAFLGMLRQGGAQALRKVNLRPGGVRSNSVTAQTLAQIDAELSARAEAAGVSTGGHNDDDTGSHTLDVFS